MKRVSMPPKRNENEVSEKGKAYHDNTATKRHAHRFVRKMFEGSSACLREQYNNSCSTKHLVLSKIVPFPLVVTSGTVVSSQSGRSPRSKKKTRIRSSHVRVWFNLNTLLI